MEDEVLPPSPSSAPFDEDVPMTTSNEQVFGMTSSSSSGFTTLNNLYASSSLPSLFNSQQFSNVPSSSVFGDHVLPGSSSLSSSTLMNPATTSMQQEQPSSFNGVTSGLIPPTTTTPFVKREMTTDSTMNDSKASQPVLQKSVEMSKPNDHSSSSGSSSGSSTHVNNVSVKFNLPSLATTPNESTHPTSTGITSHATSANSAQPFSQPSSLDGSKKKKKKKEKSSTGEPRFPFKVLYQKLVLDVDLYQQALVGYTDIRFTPLHNNITQISLHCLQVNVTGVHAISVNKQKPSVNSVSLATSVGTNPSLASTVGQSHSQEFSQESFIDQVSVSQIETHPTKNLDQILREFALQYELENEGTLTIKFKVPLLKKTTTTIRVYFDLKNPTSGVYFVKSTSHVTTLRDELNHSMMMDERENQEFDENGKTSSKLSSFSYPHMYTQSQLSGARSWFPCVDLLSSYHHFDFEITSHADCMIICSGELIRQVENYSGTLKTSYFKTHSIISPSSVCVAVGPFNISYSTLTLNSNTTTTTTSSINSSDGMMTGTMTGIAGGQPLYGSSNNNGSRPSSYELTLNAFYLPNYSLESIRHTLGFIKRAFLFLEEYLDFKFRDLFNSTTFNVVFIENAYTEHSSFACMCLVDANRMILEPNIIDQVQENRIKFTKLVAEQFFGNFIHPKSFSDYWLIDGIAGYLSWQFYENEFGQNAKRFKMMQSGKELLEMEKHTISLYNESVGAIPQHAQHVHDYISKKAPLVMYMIDRQVSTSHMRELLNKMLISAHLDQHSKRFSDRLLSTNSFLKTCEKKYAVDLKSFASYWIYGTGVPQFAISFKYDDMRSCVDLKVKQILPYPECPPFKGKVTFRILESEGAPNDFLVDLDREENQFEFHINSKPVKKHHRKITGGTASEAVRIKIPLKWIRFDPEQDWIKVLSFSQTQEMWIHQLNDVKDVVAQYEAIKALTFFSDTEPVIDILRSIIRDSSYFYQIRVCAVHALSKIPQPIEKKMALDVLIEYFKNQFYATSGASGASGAGTSGGAGVGMSGGVGVGAGATSGGTSGGGDVSGATSANGPMMMMMTTLGDLTLTLPNHANTASTTTSTNTSTTTTMASSTTPHGGLGSTTTTSGGSTLNHPTHPNPNNNNTTLPSFLKPNNFRNFAEYFMKKEIPLALTNFKDEKVNNETFPEVILLLLDLIKYNDDSENPFSGSFYLASLIKALSLVNTSNQKFKEKIEKIFYKYLVIDSDLIPSYHYIKTVSSLQALSVLQSSGKSDVQLDLFYRYLNFRESEQVRFAAWECLLNILDSVSMGVSVMNMSDWSGGGGGGSTTMNHSSMNGHSCEEFSLSTCAKRV
ncbi:hypothetical protein C9374_008417 [Naegleria lovaniensis]|uniref:Transcription initiation factor TFIID subunit 2 n=1 Tax=Naegleria lovaniensis TaxID=51637 RepID=A0AA88GIV2_NAELO|nr:uncharacterized protein C9374_008417 [Naegleria lovaniensis]KAG2378274.1 hypothetical protein C9374_008417 [Naegleria lovaniensis]